MKQFRYVVHNDAGAILTLAENGCEPTIGINSESDHKKYGESEWYKKQMRDLENALKIMAECNAYAQANPNQQMTINHIVTHRHNNAGDDNVEEIVTFR